MNEDDKSNLYILVVDADIADRFSTCMLLQRLGYDSFGAHSLDEARALMNDMPPAAVVLDADTALAGSADALRDDPRRGGIPLILLAPPVAGEDYDGIRDLTASIRKPIDVEAFYRALQAHIERNPRRNIRIATRLAATLGDGHAANDGYVTTLSEEGMFFRSLNPRPREMRLPVSFAIQGRTIALEAVVLYSGTFDDGQLKEPGMGMKFERISPVDRFLIKDFILEQISGGASAQRGPRC